MVWIWLVKLLVRLQGAPGRFQVPQHLHDELTPAMCRLMLAEMRLLNLSIDVVNQGRPGECHRGALDYAISHEKAQIWTGFALGEVGDLDDRCWRLHSWAVDNNRIIETTGVRRRLYVGVPLDTADRFFTFFRMSQEQAILRRLAREPVPVVELLTKKRRHDPKVLFVEPTWMVIRRLVADGHLVQEEHVFDGGTRMAYALSSSGRALVDELDDQVRRVVRSS